ncbi:Homoserine dehydrogenase [Rhodovulum sp. PH10]|nr:Homoserine dehydrogenase [Rhodovulum sp. PH10]
MDAGDLPPPAVAARRCRGVAGSRSCRRAGRPVFSAVDLAGSDRRPRSVFDDALRPSDVPSRLFGGARSGGHGRRGDGPRCRGARRAGLGRACRVRARLAPGGLRPPAGALAGQAGARGGQRPHSLRLLRQCLRRLGAAVPPGVAARFGRGAGGGVGSALLHLRGCQRQELPLHLAELHRRQAGRSGRRQGRAARRQDRGDADQAEADHLRPRRRRGVSDRAHAAGDRRGARGQALAAAPGL